MNIANKNKFPIFILSKGRPGAALIKLFLANNVDFTVVLEPQDVAKYRDANPMLRIWELKENEQGLAYARNALLGKARQDRSNYYWQFDDNIANFYEIISMKEYIVPPLVAINYAEKFTSRGVALIGFNYKQLAWREKFEYSFKRGIYCSVLTNTRIPVDYDERMKFKSDVDFSIQCLHAGYMTILINKYAMDKPAMGQTRKGGQSAGYKINTDVVYAGLLTQKWPEYCKIIKKKNGRIYARVRWSSL
jgi:hypothetical protein